MTPEQLARLPEVLFEIGKAIGSDEDFKPLFSHISELVCRLVDADSCSLMLLDAAGKRLLTKAAYGLTEQRMQLVAFNVGEGVAGWVVKEVAPALIHDVSRDDRFILLASSSTQIKSMACVPLIARTGAIGALTATATSTDGFTELDLDLLAFVAKTIALDVENMRLRKLSVTDPLTGAYNREFLHTQLPAEIEAAEQRGHALSVAMIDVDHFKTINDRFGHDVGDRVLAEVANRLRATIRSGDSLIRYGGEEFLIVLPQTDVQKAAEIGERMRTHMQDESILAGEHAVEVRISVGIAERRTSEEEPSDLIRRADTMLYAAKGRGRNRVEVEP